MASIPPRTTAPRAPTCRSSPHARSYLEVTRAAHAEVSRLIEPQRDRGEELVAPRRLALVAQIDAVKVAVEEDVFALRVAVGGDGQVVARAEGEHAEALSRRDLPRSASLVVAVLEADERHERREERRARGVATADEHRHILARRAFDEPADVGGAEAEDSAPRVGGRRAVGVDDRAREAPQARWIRAGVELDAPDHRRRMTLGPPPA